MGANTFFDIDKYIIKSQIYVSKMINSIYNGLELKDKQILETLLKNNGLKDEEIGEIYDGKFITDYIVYENLSREDKIKICILLIKTLLRRKGSFIFTQDHYT